MQKFGLHLCYAVLFSASYWIAYCLRFDFRIPPHYFDLFLRSLPFIVAIKLGVFLLMKTTHGWWYLFTFRDLTDLAKTLAIAFGITVFINHYFSFLWIPRAILIMDVVCAGLLITVCRSGWRVAHEGKLSFALHSDCQRVLMVPNGEESILFAHRLNSLPQTKHRVVGWVKTNENDAVGTQRAGIPVVGRIEDAVEKSAALGVTAIWVPVGVPGDQLRLLRDATDSADLQLKVIPNRLEINPEHISVRDIDINDLLQREPVELDHKLIGEQVHGRRVMVTGAGGSIGSEICRQLLLYAPSEIVLLDHRENSVFLIHNELSDILARRASECMDRVASDEKREPREGERAARSENQEAREDGNPTRERGFEPERQGASHRPASSEQRETSSEQRETSSENSTPEQGKHPSLASRLSPLEAQRSKPAPPILHPCVGDILDEPRMRHLFETHRPEIVYHAAAHKHVGLMEVNPGEALKNNVFGTKQVADLAHEFSTKKFVLISTDKAVKPTSIMGATKQIAEQYVAAMSSESETRFVIVRFGNVLGSNGSVVPIFKDQIASGGPITITDERMTRYFMTIPEASQLVLQAAAMGLGGEIFVLEMGEQLRILDLAREMVRLAGLPLHSIEIEIVGKRKGEKLREELFSSDEQQKGTSHPMIHQAESNATPSLAELSRQLSDYDAVKRQVEASLHLRELEDATANVHHC